MEGLEENFYTWLVWLGGERFIIVLLQVNGATSRFVRGTQRIVSVDNLFGRPVIASNFRLGKCHLELS